MHTHIHAPHTYTQVPLKAAGIVPSEDHAYPAEDFRAAIQGAYGVSFDIHCMGDGKLTEVGVCVSAVCVSAVCLL